MRVAAFLYWNLGVEYLKILLEAGHEVVSVVTPPSNPRVQLPPGFSVEEFAHDNYLPVYKPALDRINSPEFVEVIRRLRPDLILACYFPKVLSPSILSIPRLGCVNTHPSVLPKDRGMFPVFMPVVRRDRTAGITVFSLDPGVDTGDIIAQRTFELDEGETGYSITQKLCDAGAQMLREILPLLECGKAPRTPQNNDEATYFNWRPKKHARIRWTQTTEEVDALIRALGGLYGGAHSFLGKRKVVFNAASPAPEHLTGIATSAVPGQVVAYSGSGYLVRTGDGVIEILDVAFEDGKAPSVEEAIASSNQSVIFS